MAMQDADRNLLRSLPAALAPPQPGAVPAKQVVTHLKRSAP